MIDEERSLTPEEKEQEDKLLKKLADAIGLPLQPCGRYKLMVVPVEGGKSVIAMVFLPSKDSTTQVGLVIDFIDVAGFVLEVSKEYIKTHPKQNLPNIDRLMVS